MKKILVILIALIIYVDGELRLTPDKVNTELDSLYRNDPAYYLDVLCSSDELQGIVELVENDAPSYQLRRARTALYEKIKRDSNLR